MKKFLTSLILFVLLLMPNVSKAAITCSTDKHSAEASINKDKIKVGETAQITVKSDDKYQVEYKIAPKDFAEINDSGLIKALKDGNIKINLTINYLTDSDEIDDTCKISIPLDILSSDSSLKRLNIEEFDISSIFSSTKYDYEVKLPYKYEKINIIAEANSGTAKITGDGRRYLNEGKNDYSIVVTASDGTSTTYKINIIRQEANDDASLQSLDVKGLTLNPKFKSNIFHYEIDTSEDIEQITIDAKPTYEYAKIYGIGTYALATGKNNYYIKVVAENGSEVKYELVINKNYGSSYLKDLKVENYSLSPSFNKETYTYKLTVKSDVDSIDIKPIANDNDQLEIVGNENLKTGDNEVLIRVTGNDKKTTTYKIIVNKLTKEKEVIIKKKNTLVTVLFIIFVISIIIMASCIAIFLKRNYKFKKPLKLNKKSKKSKKKNKKR